MKQLSRPVVFGEALFDCFPGGESVLGGAPFNVAWHLQALGDAPQFISRVGRDELGKHIIDAMQEWGMSTGGIQFDTQHPTGRVVVTVEDNEPHYDIAIDAAYDFIDFTEIAEPPLSGLFYHGTLAARNPVAHTSLRKLTETPGLGIFVDVNLRAPWWSKDDTCRWLEQASWVKLNQDELQALGFHSADLEQDMTRMHSNFSLDQLIVTCGDKGAVVRDKEGEFHRVQPTAATRVVDTVGAGDAFTALYIHGLLAGWPIEHILHHAQAFASRVVGQRGAISRDRNLYRDFVS